MGDPATHARKQKRRRELVDITLESLLDAGEIEEDEHENDPFFVRPDPTAGLSLIDIGNLDIYTTWYSLGGHRNPPTPLEILHWPPELKLDFAYLDKRLDYLRRRRDRAKKRKDK